MRLASLSAAAAAAAVLVPAALAFASPSAFGISGLRGGTDAPVGSELRRQRQRPSLGTSVAGVEEEVASPAPPSSGETRTLAADGDFIKSLPDSRSYRAIELSNGLKCLLVSDPQTDVEAGAVHINSGHFQDPERRPGLAHFHEHMLFLGTEKYPGESDLEAYLSRNGGSSNAFTDMEDTNYYFSVAPLDHDDDRAADGGGEAGPGGATEDGGGLERASSALSGALDRMAQFFVAPTFNAAMVERELRAIDSEYLNSVSSDSWRNYQLLKSYANPDHPFVKFGCGNYDTLTDGGDIAGEAAELSGGTNPREDLIKFWEDNYQTPKMRLCVVGKANLDALQRSVEETFGLVKPPSDEWIAANQQESPPDDGGDGALFLSEHARYGVAPFDKDRSLGMIREVVPVVESRLLKLQFATPPMEDPKLVETRPYRVLSHLLGHESPGSLHSLLNEEGLINGLTSGVGIDTSDFSLCSINLSLTPKGMKERDRVLSLVWQWISLIKTSVGNDDQNGLMQKYHDEMRDMSNVNFRYRENGDPTDFCSTAAGMLFEYEPAKLLAGSSLTDDYDAEIARAFLDRFSPKNCLLAIWDPDLVNDEAYEEMEYDTSASAGNWKKEKWYGAKHRQVPIPDTLVTEWEKPTEIDPRLRLPKLNEFIPQDFTLRCDDDGFESPSVEIPLDCKKIPPTVVLEKPGLRLWHKMDKTFRVPRTYIKIHLSSPNPYHSPRSMTLNRLYAKVLRDDLNEYVYDASIAGCNYSVTCLPLGFRVSVSGFSEKLPHLLEVVTSRMLTLIEEMKEGPAKHPGLEKKFSKAQQNLLRETKNFRMESPYETCSYLSRMLVENNVWHVDQYVGEMEGDYADANPLTMGECALAAEESLLGPGKAEAMCMGNINSKEAQEVGDIILDRFLEGSRPLQNDEIPKFGTLKNPTRQEAKEIFGAELPAIPIKLEQVAYADSEENNAIQLILQTGCEHTLGWEGIATQELFSYIAYNSCFDQLRTKEQLGYIVSCFTRKTAGGGSSFSVVVQSSSTSPAKLEERCEAWLETFRQELEEMPEERVAMEAAAVAAQLLERDTKLGDEVGSAWGAITPTTELSPNIPPPFDRLEKLATYLSVESSENEDSERKVTAAGLKQNMIDLFDKFLSASSPERRAVCARVYCQSAKQEFEDNKGKPGVLSDYAAAQELKKFLAGYPTAPYWASYPSSSN